MPTGRPSVLHDGFLIPNAADVNNPRMAEPDRVDFNTLAHPLWGVIEGCLVTCAGTTAHVDVGTVLVNGKIVTVTASVSVDLGSGDVQDRFDLIVVNAGGNISFVRGLASVDPVFPDPPANATVLAAVFVPPAASSLVDNVIDKRKFISKALLTKIATTDDLVRNLNGSGNHYLIDGGGKTTWENDTYMWRSAPETLSIHKHLLLDGTLTAAGLSVSGDISATGNVMGNNLIFDSTPMTVVGPYDVGTIWQNPVTGNLSIWQNNQWKQLATIESGIPVGTVITSMETADVMTPLGWLPLDGTTIDETHYPRLFTVKGLLHLIVASTPRRMTLPKADGLTLVTNWRADPGTKHSPRDVGGAVRGNTVVLTLDNLPTHGHAPRVQNSGAATPTVTVRQAPGHIHDISGGSHGHDVTDPHHRHRGMDLGGIAAPVIALMWNGQNKIDALFNDRNHTYSVEQFEWSYPALSNVTVNPSDSHFHGMWPDNGHDHQADITNMPDHNHPVLENTVGLSTPFDVTPESLNVFTYIRS